MKGFRGPGLITPLGLVLVLVGLVWFAQGVGWLGGSSMSGETLWAVIGPVVAVVGGILTAIGLSAPARRKSHDG
ncbi:MAG: hypothetical protein ACJ72O_13070 [Marmoricola sp.]